MTCRLASAFTCAPVRAIPPPGPGPPGTVRFAVILLLAGLPLAQAAHPPVTPQAGPYRAARDRSDHHQADPERHVHHVVQEHLDPDEHQQAAMPA